AGSAMTMRETMRARTMRRRPQMTEAASAGEGRVNVIVRGGYADVWVAGRNHGSTPRSLVLPAGSHTVELRFFGESPGERRRVDVRDGETARLAVTAPSRE
ncbi:MAG: PEGA domain-containing protein, partial [Myxococcota bacterium]